MRNKKVLLVAFILLCCAICAFVWYKSIANNEDVIKDCQYDEYISGFYDKGQFVPFEYSGELDLVTTLRIASLMVDNNYAISEEDRKELANSFREQNIKEKYELKGTFTNEGIKAWYYYLDITKKTDEEEYVFVCKEAKKMISEILSSWDENINSAKADDILTELNILSSYKQINEYLQDSRIDDSLQEILKEKISKVDYSEIDIVPFAYYMIKMGVKDKYDKIEKNAILEEIDSIIEEDQRDDYSSYYFYLPFIHDVVEYYFPGEYEQRYREYNIGAIERFKSNNELGWTELWKTLNYTNDIISKDEKKQLLSSLGIADGMKVGEKKIIYLMNSYSNIYYYLYLAKESNKKIESEESKTIKDILKGIDVESVDIKELYYCLKLTDLESIDVSDIIDTKEVEDNIRNKTKNMSYGNLSNIYYLIILNQEYSLFDEAYIENVISEQKKVIEQSAYMEEDKKMLYKMFDIAQSDTPEKYSNIVDSSVYFTQNIYFMSYFTKKMDKKSISKSISEINNRNNEYGYSCEAGGNDIELEATYRLIYAINNLDF